MKNKFKISREVLLQLADNNSYSEEILKKECPKLFESEIKLNNWYKSKDHQSMLIYPTSIEEPNNSLYGYGFNSNGLFRVYDKDTSNNCLCNDVASKRLVLATPKEVETVLKSEFEKQSGFKYQQYKFEDNTLKGKYHCWVTWTDLFKDGRFLPPTDIITIVEKYGKDKVQEYLNNAK